MLGAGAHFCFPTISGIASSPDHTNATPSIRTFSSSVSSSSNLAIRLGSSSKRCLRSKHFFICCDSSSSSRGSFGCGSNGDDHDLHDYLEASLLLSETISHYRMRRRGFQDDAKWQNSGNLVPFSPKKWETRAEINSLGLGFLQRFQNPTIFLKIYCDGDFLLPIVVGEFAVEKLIIAHWGVEKGDCPDQFQFLRNTVEQLGYEVNMVKITERVVNTYFARLFFSKPGENEILSVDARPSDAINLENRCKAPIYVNKQIILTDAISIDYGGRVRSKSTYDVSLDSAADGPDYLVKELDLVRNINLAVKEERYEEAAMWKDRLLELRKSIHEH
ncbi:hypothetical protein UlMin_039706 [Ulmus minor]